MLPKSKSTSMGDQSFSETVTATRLSIKRYSKRALILSVSVRDAAITSSEMSARAPRFAKLERELSLIFYIKKKKCMILWVIFSKKSFESQ